MINAIGIISIQSDPLSDIRGLYYLQACHLYQVEAYLYSASELKTFLSEGCLRAYTWGDGAPKQCLIDIPRYTEIYRGMYQILQNFPDEMRYFLKNTKLTDAFGLYKDQLQKYMLLGTLSEYAIPTFPIRSFDELLPMLRVIPNAILKPANGSRGLGIMKIKTKNEKTVYQCGKISGELTRDAFEHYFKEENKKSIVYYLLEPCLNITNYNGYAVDFRCLVSLGGKGDWENVLTYARIGSSEIASNVSTGGLIADAVNVLEELVPNQAEETLEKINRIALDVAELVQKNAKNPVSYLGIDICIDRDTKQIYVIEANSKPGLKNNVWSLALVRAQYFKYLLAQNS